jgi:hypothetical protein
VKIREAGLNMHSGCMCYRPKADVQTNNKSPRTINSGSEAIRCGLLE